MTRTSSTSTNVKPPLKKVVRVKRNEIRTKYFDESFKTVIVHFENFFGEESEEYNEFVISLASKKAYFKMIHIIVNENNIILNRNDELAQNFMYRYYSLKRYIDDFKYQDKHYTVFLNDLTGLFEDRFVEEIKKYVNENYKKDVGDEYDEDKQKYEAGITFLDYHLKILYVISRMTRLIIPLCIHYIHTYPGTVETNTFLVAAFTNLFNISQAMGYFNRNDAHEIIDKRTDVYQKLYTFVQRKVEKTLHTDAAMWERQAIFGVNPKTSTEDIMNKLMTNIIPEYAFKQKVMNLNAVMIKKTVGQYILRKKDPYNINCIVDTDASQVDDESVVGEAEIFDSYNNRKNELVLLTRKIFNDDTVDIIMRRNDITISPQEFIFYHTHYKAHQFQTFIILQTFFRYFGGTENIYANNKRAHVQLLIIAIKLLERADVPELIKYITGERTRHFINKRESRSLKITIAANPLYKTIVDTKYKNIQNVLKKQNFIEHKISLLMNNEYVYNEYNNPLNGTPIERNEEEIINGVLKFFTRMIF